MAQGLDGIPELCHVFNGESLVGLLVLGTEVQAQTEAKDADANLSDDRGEHAWQVSWEIFLTEDERGQDTADATHADDDG